MKSTLGRWMVRTSPTVFAAYAPLALLAANLAEVQPSVATRSVLASTGLGLAVTILCLLLVRPSDRAVVLACAIVIAFFTYGRIYDGLKELGRGDVLLARHRYLIPLSGLLILALGVSLGPKPRAAAGLARWLTVSAWILGIFPIVSLVRYQAQAWRSSPWRDSLELSVLQAPVDPPDVFYIILDGYGRSDVLADRYGYNNTPFLDFLRSRGFYVADQAMSNYSYTLLSLSSSLNMDYLDSMLGEERIDPRDPDPLHKELHRNRVFRAFRRLGYSIVAFETGYWPAELTEADLYLAPEPAANDSDRSFLGGAGLNEFEGLFLETTMAAVVVDFYTRERDGDPPDLFDAEYDQHRRRVLFTVSNLSEFAADPGAHFVFAHVISPHPPFVFGPDGEGLTPLGVFSLKDRCCHGGDYPERYVGQVRHLNGLLMGEIDEILQAAHGNVIILLQGDHGPAGFLNWKKPEVAAIRDRMAILNAYYLPGSARDVLYPSISPVNTFRVIFDRYFGGDFGLLADVGYFTPTLDLSNGIQVPPRP